MYLNVKPYQELLEGITVALRINEGIVKLTGRDGAGKSALCLELTRMLEAKGKRVLYFPSAPATIESLQDGILAALNITPRNNFTKLLTRYLLQKPNSQRHLYVIFDEAQSIDEPVFDSIRMLCNIQDEREALVKPVICGTSALDKKLANVSYRAITQYLCQSFTLSPMTIEQLRDFYWMYWNKHGIQVQPPSNTVITNLFKDGHGFPGPALAKLDKAYERVLDRREGRRTEAQPLMQPMAQPMAEPLAQPVEQPLAQPVAPRRMSSEVLLAACFGVLLFGVGSGMYYLYQSIDDERPAPTNAAEPPETPAVAIQEQVEVVAPGSIVQPVEGTPEAPALAVTPEPEAPAVTIVMAAASEISVPVAPESVPAPEVEAAVVLAEAVVAEAVVAEAAVDESAAPVVDIPEDVPEDIPESGMSVETLLAEWVSSWQSKDVDGYLGHYDRDFEPASGDSRDAWDEQRRASIGRASDILISHDSIEIMAEDDSRLTVQFWLHYSASNYADDTLKELVLRKSAEGLRILSERNLLVERPQ
jgi:hypothetical protein